MGSSQLFLEIFAAEPSAATGVPFARYMELAMYHPTAGYYTRDFRRVGKDKAADFFTATTFSPVFVELVVAATVRLLGRVPPGELTFVEIGAEPAGGALKNVAHPFKEYRTISFGQPITLPPRCVAFSNELFDAQPFHRVVFRRGAWRELGVALQDGALREVELAAFSPEVAAAANRLPAAAANDYHLDLPLRTETILQPIAAQPWTGLFLAFDYGKSWRELAEELPGGTGRTYYRQKMGSDLLGRPGEQDLTCHVCWDWLADGLQNRGFGEAVVESQESFFMRHAAPALEAITTAEAGKFSPRKQMVQQLLHPGNMGRKFQALHALRV
ncbi:MAG: SAM-dependent methyltransferase [Opitutae bacterium]|nr:SAM-dependent methyltransferase [Opitutae bacterium]